MSPVTTSHSDGELFDDRYELQGAPLGVGEFGEVWRAHDQHRDHVVALKILTNTLEDDAWHEAQRLTSLESPNILRVNNADIAVDVPYIDSVLAASGTVADEMAPLGMTPARAVHLVRGALRGLQLCHDRGVLHRDVKPANIFIGGPGDALLGDFGCAGVMAADGTAKPAGDPNVRPLDVLKGKSANASSDVYGMGITLYAMLTGALPFSISAAGDFKTHRDNVAGGMPDIRDVAPHVSIVLAKVVRKATAPKQVDRYETAAEFSDALASLAAVDADICRATPSAGTVNHSGHDRCWSVVRRRDQAVFFVCVHRAGGKQHVVTCRENGRRLVAHCKDGMNTGALLVHLRKVFSALR